jgi:hypothetical protein
MATHGANGTQGNRATIILLDGARPDVFQSLVEAGDLPNIARYVLEPGGQVPATTVFPSTTMVAYLPFLTGGFPGRCDVPGIRWLDRRAYGGRWIRDRRHVRSYCGVQGGLLNSDLPDGMATLFDIEADSTAICSPFTRGLAAHRHRCSVARMIIGGRAHYTAGYEPLDRRVGRELVAQARSHPRFLFAVLPGIDGIAHCYHPHHRRVLDLYRAFDRDLGRYLAAAGAGPDHLLMLVSDHGFSRVHHHVDLALALERIDIPTLRHPKLWRRNPAAAVMVSGNAAAHVYLAPGVTRDHRWSIPVIEAGDIDGIPRFLVSYLADLHGVDFVAGVDGDDIILVSSAGRSRLTLREDGRIRYAPETADVLGLGREPATRDRDGWLRASIDGSHPDGPVQLAQLFESNRTGDLVVSASAGADLRSEWEFPEHLAGHGSLRAVHMRCLMAINKPVVGPMRTVDAFPLVLDHLGYPVPESIDGVMRPESSVVPRPAAFAWGA